MSNITKPLACGVLLCLAATHAIAAGADASAPMDCLIEPKMVVDVSSPVPGVLVEILVEKSDVVERGQPIARLESALQKARVEQARSRASAVADIEAATANLDFARRNLERLEGLMGGGAVATHHLDEARTDLALAQSQLKKAHENRASAGMDLKHAVESLNQRTIRSPISGVVVARYRSPGEFVEAEPIVQLATLDPLKVEVIAPAQLFGSIRPNMRGSVVAESSSDAYAARVSLVDRVVDAASGTFGVRLELPNPDYRLPGGLKCKVEIFADVADEAGVAGGNPAAQTPSLASPMPGLAAQDAEATQACVTVGPIDDHAQADRVKAALAAYASDMGEREVVHSAAAGFLVLTPQQASTSDAFALADRLRALGVTDLVVMGRNPYRDQVSLGYYHTERSARARQGALQTLGIDTGVVARTTDRSQIWLDFSLSGLSDDQATLDRALKQTEPNLSLASLTCPEPSVSVAGI